MAIQKIMEFTVRIPDDLARRITADGSDLSRRALEVCWFSVKW
jgi:hypothetical protein